MPMMGPDLRSARIVESSCAPRSTTVSTVSMMKMMRLADAAEATVGHLQRRAHTHAVVRGRTGRTPESRASVAHCGRRENVVDLDAADGTEALEACSIEGPHLKLSTGFRGLVHRRADGAVRLLKRSVRGTTDYTDTHNNQAERLDLSILGESISEAVKARCSSPSAGMAADASRDRDNSSLGPVYAQLSGEAQMVMVRDSHGWRKYEDGPGW